MSKKKTKRIVTKSKIKAKKSKHVSKSTVLLFAISLILLAFFCGFKQQQLAKRSFAYTPPTYKAAKVDPPAGPPIEIKISSLQLDLPIIESKIQHGEWEVNPEGASHLINSAKPGEGNNIVIYGHNFTNLFGAIRNISAGDVITIKTSTGKEFSYRALQIMTVDPSEIHVVMPTSKEVLTLFTCDGFADSQRFVVQAVPLQTSARLVIQE